MPGMRLTKLRLKWLEIAVGAVMARAAYETLLVRPFAKLNPGD